MNEFQINCTIQNHCVSSFHGITQWTDVQLKANKLQNSNHAINVKGLGVSFASRAVQLVSVIFDSMHFAIIKLSPAKTNLLFRFLPN